MRFQRAEETVGEHENTLTYTYARPTGKTAVDFGHNTCQLFVTHEDSPHRILVIVEGIIETAHISALYAEDHVDPSLLEDPSNPFTGERFFL